MGFHPPLIPSADTTSTIIRQKAARAPVCSALLLMQVECQSSPRPPTHGESTTHPSTSPLVSLLGFAIRVSAINQSSSLNDKGGGPKPKSQGKAYLQRQLLFTSLDRRLIILPAGFVCASPLVARRPPHFQPRPAYPDRPSLVFGFSSHGTARYLILFLELLLS